MDFYTRSKRFVEVVRIFLYEQNLHAHLHLACATWAGRLPLHMHLRLGGAEKKGISFIYRTPPPSLTACKGHACMPLGHMLIWFINYI
jgi:hypothetical protein